MRGRRNWLGRGAGITRGVHPEKTDPGRRKRKLAFICPKKRLSPGENGRPSEKRARIHAVDPRTRRAAETTQRVTGYDPSIGRDGRSPKKPGRRQTVAGGRNVQLRRRDGLPPGDTGRLVGVKVI